MKWLIGSILGAALCVPAFSQTMGAVEALIPQVTAPSLPSGCAVLFPTTSDLAAATCRLIDNARTEVIISSTAITSPTIINKLIERATVGGVAVFILLDADPGFANYAAPDAFEKAHVQIAWMGIRGVVYDATYLIIDRQVLMTGYGFSVESSDGLSAALIISEPGIVTRYYNEFARVIRQPFAFENRDKAKMARGIIGRGQGVYSPINGRTSEDYIP